VTASLYFYVVFQGLALWAACVLLSVVVPLAPGRVLQAIAKPARKAVATLTPASVPAWANLSLTVFWLLSLRIAFYLVMANYGLLPQATA
jgi:hypothetical protein